MDFCIEVDAQQLARGRPLRGLPRNAASKYHCCVAAAFVVGECVSSPFWGSVGPRMLPAGLMSATVRCVGFAQAKSTGWLKKVEDLEGLAAADSIDTASIPLSKWLPLLLTAYEEAAIAFDAGDVHGMVEDVHRVLKDWLG